MHIFKTFAFYHSRLVMFNLYALDIANQKHFILHQPLQDNELQMPAKLPPV